MDRREQPWSASKMTTALTIIGTDPTFTLIKHSHIYDPDCRHLKPETITPKLCKKEETHAKCKTLAFVFKFRIFKV